LIKRSRPPLQGVDAAAGKPSYAPHSGTQALTIPPYCTFSAYLGRTPTFETPTLRFY